MEKCRGWHPWVTGDWTGLVFTTHPLHRYRREVIQVSACKEWYKGSVSLRCLNTRLKTPLLQAQFTFLFWEDYCPVIKTTSQEGAMNLKLYTSVKSHGKKSHDQTWKTNTNTVNIRETGTPGVQGLALLSIKNGR